MTNTVMDLSTAPSPCYVIDMEQLEINLEILKQVQTEAGCKIILALKGFAAFSTFPLISQYLAGTTASSVNEALLGQQEFGKEVHVYAPAFSRTPCARSIRSTVSVGLAPIPSQWRMRSSLSAE